MEKIVIGEIVKAVGLKGEVKLYSYSGLTGRYQVGDYIFAGENEYRIERVRIIKNSVILKLSGIEGRDAAEAACGLKVSIGENSLPELPEGTYYVRDLIGLPVFDEFGDPVGHVSDIVTGSAQDLYEIDTIGGKRLIPAVDEFIKFVDIEKKRIEVKLIEGLI